VSDILTPEQVRAVEIMVVGVAVADAMRSLAASHEALRARADEAGQQTEWWREEAGGYQRARVRAEARVAELEAVLRDVEDELEYVLDEFRQRDYMDAEQAAKIALRKIRALKVPALSAAPPEEPTT